MPLQTWNFAWLTNYAPILKYWIREGPGAPAARETARARRAISAPSYGENLSRPISPSRTVETGGFSRETWGAGSAGAPSSHLSIGVYCAGAQVPSSSANIPSGHPCPFSFWASRPSHASVRRRPSAARRRRHVPFVGLRWTAAPLGRRGAEAEAQRMARRHRTAAPSCSSPASSASALRPSAAAVAERLPPREAAAAAERPPLMGAALSSWQPAAVRVARSPLAGGGAALSPRPVVEAAVLPPLMRGGAFFLAAGGGEGGAVSFTGGGGASVLGRRWWRRFLLGWRRWRRGFPGGRRRGSLILRRRRRFR